MSPFNVDNFFFSGFPLGFRSMDWECNCHHLYSINEDCTVMSRDVLGNGSLLSSDIVHV